MKLKAEADSPSEVEVPEGTVELRFRPRGALLKNGATHLDSGTDSNFVLYSEKQVQRFAQEMLDTKREIIKVELDLKMREDESKAAGGKQERLAERDRRIQEEFQRDPEVVALCDEIALADEQRQHARRTILQGNDPARQRAEEKYKSLRLEYNKLWEEKYPEICERLRAAGPAPRGTESIKDLKKKLESLKTKRAKQVELFEKLKVELVAGRLDRRSEDKLSESASSLSERLQSALDTGDKAKAAEIREALKRMYQAAGD